MMTQKEPESAGFKSDQHLAAATRHSPSPYFLPSPSLPFFAFFPTSASPVLVPTCCSLLLMESSLVTRGALQERTSRSRYGNGNWVEAVLYQLALGSTGGAGTCKECKEWGAVWWQCLWHSTVHRVGKALCCTGKCAQGNRALHGGEHCGMLLCVEKLWKKHFEELKTGCLWGTRECDSKVCECDPHRKNVPYPWL